jgi:hypothetical protein
MVFIIFFIILLSINNVILLIVSLPVFEAFFTNTLPLVGSWDYKNIYDGTMLTYVYFFGLWAIIFIVFCICNLIFINFKIQNNNIILFKKYSIIIKIATIPFWIINIILHIGIIYIFLKYYNILRMK